MATLNLTFITPKGGWGYRPHVLYSQEIEKKSEETSSQGAWYRHHKMAPQLSAQVTASLTMWSTARAPPKNSGDLVVLSGLNQSSGLASLTQESRSPKKAGAPGRQAGHTGSKREGRVQSRSK